MTRLAEVKAERDALARDAEVARMILWLSVTESAQHVEHFKETSGPGRYVVSGYGLDRADGGYVVVRFIFPGQHDSVSGYRFDTWADSLRESTLDSMVPFRIAADRITSARYRIVREIAKIGGAS
jgi:hypothetical protein